MCRVAMADPYAALEGVQLLSANDSCCTACSAVGVGVSILHQSQRPKEVGPPNLTKVEKEGFDRRSGWHQVGTYDSTV